LIIFWALKLQLPFIKLPMYHFFVWRLDLMILHIWGQIHYKGYWKGRALKIETFFGLEMTTREGTLIFNTERTKCWAWRVWSSVETLFTRFTVHSNKVNWKGIGCIFV
jgi:hypothetical protein